MKHFITTAASLLVASAHAHIEERSPCSGGAVNDGGNWYCQEVDAITYTGVGGAGSYNKVTNMDGASGSCSSTPFAYSGTLAPLDEDVSLHFRGPITLKQFAVYTPSGSSTKKTRRSHKARHAHDHAHAHEKRALGDEVVATINGKVVSWANDYTGAAATPAPAANPIAAVSAAVAGIVNPAASSSSSSYKAKSTTPVSSGAAGSWSRQAYYDSASKTADGLTFLNHFGGSGSGVFDYAFGNSLSYASTNGQAGASSPQVLEDCTVPSDAEFIIMSDNECSGNDCGYVRPGTVAHHGFSGPNKAFFFEFGMPDDGKSSASIYEPVNMPAIWMLNAQIPRTLQYGKAECSCWTSGCAEFDIFEVLAAGDKRCKSTLHGNINGGSSDYFARPTTGTIKAVLLMTEDNIHIKILDNSYVFGTSIDESTISDICASTSKDAEGISLFALAS